MFRKFLKDGQNLAILPFLLRKSFTEIFDISLTCNHNPDSLRLLELFDADGHVSRFPNVEHPELVLFECPDHIVERLALPRYRVAALKGGVLSRLILPYV